MPTLPEDLVILAIGAKPRGGPNNGKLPWRFCYGMRGAVLVALTLAGRVEVTDGRIVVRDPAPLGDPNLDAELARLAASRGIPVGMPGSTC
jgi:Golgi phosphoprotein 3 (GPP34)